ncbi:hypothetical protein J5J83_14300 [Azoarcus sp. L1K30]|uniref:hypothetical protein n=1 Tax=Azoarcus sp. L1K30 TaxID=2820277 RepID=UPI001B826748|nr:hypothetical protein [Azoarcus sp. L1K30]MBR0567290.1 hypothetical protein [Azoarcus sp. L1K30]
MLPLRVVSLFCLVLALTLLQACTGVEAADVIVRPPESETRASPSGTFVLELALQPQGSPHAPRATATLLRIDASARKVLWTRTLPHRPRPRFVLVGDGGQVVLLDEWLNVRSDLAVMVIDRHNEILAQLDLEAVRAALGVPIADLAPHARYGLWIQTPPTINQQGDAVEVAAADRVLSIRFSDGALSVR